MKSPGCSQLGKMQWSTSTIEIEQKEKMYFIIRNMEFFLVFQKFAFGTQTLVFMPKVPRKIKILKNNGHVLVFPEENQELFYSFQVTYSFQGEL